MTSHIINRAQLPSQFPTNRHEPNFWEALGRAVGTFGFLEEVLMKAIFAFTATKSYPEHEIASAYENWVKVLTRTLSDPLGNLIDTYGKAVRENPAATIENLETLLQELRKVSRLRNAICHGSWQPPDACGFCIPFYVDKKGDVFDIPIDQAYLEKLQQETSHLACSVIETVTHMGWRFPGSGGPGIPIWTKTSNPQSTSA